MFFKRLNQLVFLSPLLLLFAGVAAHAAELDARLDRTEVVEGEPIVLTLSTDGGASGTPDLAPLQQDFDLVNQGQSSSMSFVNGRMSSRREWHLTLMPRRTGTIEIPAIPFGTGASRPLSLDVLPAAAAARRGVDLPVLVEADVAPESPFVQQQLVYTVRVLHAVPLRDANLSLPQVDGALVYPLGDDSRFETYRNGRKYQAVERRFAILPQRSGDLLIGGPVLTARVPDTAASGQQPPGGSLRDRFFGNDPFAGVFGQSRPVQSRAPERRIEIRPQPAGSPTPWLPAESLTLNETWSPDGADLRVGEPVTRTVVITAQGLADAQLPEIDLAAGANGVKVYPDRAQSDTRPDNGTLVSQKVLKAAIVPQQAGRLTLPELTLTWWDVNDDRQRTARIPARTVLVAPAPDGAATQTPRQTVPSQTAPSQPAASDSTTAAARDAEGSVGEETAARESGGGDALWRWLAGLFALAWIGAMLLWWRARGGAAAAAPVAQRAARPGAAAPSRPGRRGLDDLAGAFARNDPRVARQALVDWGQRQWPDRAIHALDGFAQQLDPGARPVVMQIDAVLFGRGATDWNGSAAWEQLRPYLARATGVRGDSDGASALPPLYPGGGAPAR